MATIQEAKQQVQEARQKISQARTILTEQRGKISETESRLIEAKKSLPDITSQRALRSQKYGGGLRGRLVRRKIKETSEDISKRLDLLGESREKLKKYEEGILDYEKQVKSYEEQIKKVEQAQAKIRREQEAYKLAKKFYYKKISPYWINDEVVKKYLKEFYTRERLARESFAKQVEEFQRSSGGEKLIVDWENMRVKGVQSSALGKTFSVEEYNKLIEGLKKDIPKVDTKRLDRISKLDLDKFNKAVFDIEVKSKNMFGREIFPLVSASSKIYKENLPISVNLEKARGKPSSFIAGTVMKVREKIGNLRDSFYDLKKEPPEITQKVNIITPSGIITSTYPIGAGGTATIFPLTLEQEKRLRKAQEKGSVKGMINLIGSGLTTASEGIGKGVGYATTIKGVPDTFEKRGFPEEISGGKIIRTLRETLPKIGEYSEEKVGQFVDWTKIKQTKTIPSQKKQVYLHETMMYGGETPTKLTIPEHEELTPVGFFGKVTGKTVRYAPEALAYYFGGEYMLGADIITGSEKLRTLERDYKKELNKQYESQKQKLIKQGYSKKEIPTKEEFEKKYGSQIKKDMEKNIALWDIGLPSVLLGVSGTGRVAKKLSKPKIEFEALNIKTPEESLEIIGKPSTVIYSPSAKKQATIYEDILTFSQEGKGGRKTIIKNFLGDELFGGIPYGKEGSEAYKKALKFLKKKGYTEAQAKKLMRLRQPELKQNIFKGTALVVEGEEGTLIKLLGAEESKPLLTEVKGIRTRQPLGTMKFINLLAEPTGEKKGIELYKFASNIEKSFLTKEGRPFTKLSQAGKTTTSVEGISGVKKIGEVDLLGRKIKTGTREIKAREIKSYDVYQSADIIKQTIPKKRAVSISKGLTLAEKGKPEVIINLDELLGIKSKGKKSSQQYLQQLYSPKQTTQKLTKVLKEVAKKSKVPKITEKTTLEASTKKDYGILPLVSASTTQKPQSQYYGAGMYERTESYGASVPSAQTTSIKATPIQPINLGSLSVFTQRFKQPTKISQISKLQQLKAKQKPLADIKTEQISKLSQISKESPLPKQRSFLRTLLGLKQRQAQRLLQKQKTMQTTQKVTPKEPKPKLTHLIESSKTIKEKKGIKKAKEKIELFKAFVRKKGKDILLGEFETLGGAKRGLKKELLGTLRASGFIKKGGKKIKINLGYGFRPSKKDIFRIVQKKTLRFGTKGEIKEAQFFRKKKERKIKLI